ncbi:hypothetical protein D9M68_995940 [compost metagenome]
MRRRAGGDELAVDDEHQVEQRGFRLPGDGDVPVDVHAGVGGQFGVEPQVVPPRAATAHGQGTEFDLSFAHGEFLLEGSYLNVAAVLAQRPSYWRMLR